MKKCLVMVVHRSYTFKFGAPGGIRTRDLRLSRLYVYKAAAITGLSHRGFTGFPWVSPHLKSSYDEYRIEFLFVKVIVNRLARAAIDRNRTADFSISSIGSSRYSGGYPPSQFSVFAKNIFYIWM